MSNGTPAAFRAGSVAIVGRPNVGKSTLLNRILGEKVAITASVPQTTRTRILGVRTLPQAQLVLLDTPGIHRPKHRLNRRMVQSARSALESADAVLFLVEATAPPGPGDQYILQALKASKRPVILVLNKIDLVKKSRLLPLLEAYARQHDFAEMVPASALTGENVDRLIEVLVRHLPEGEPLFEADALTDQPMRTLAAEIIREKILHRTREEIPYAVAVLLEEFKDDARKNLVSLRATLLVERESQKKIVIGQKGRLLKEAGREARLELEQRLGRKVYLELWVKVAGDWRQNERMLKELGY